MSADVKTAVDKLLRTIAEQFGIALPPVQDRSEIVDELGFSSLMVATLVANLDELLGVDPFQAEDVMITDLRTVRDLCKVYEHAVETLPAHLPARDGR